MEKKLNAFFETASFHIIKPCNMRCKFCYATFEDMHVPHQLTRDEAFDILDKLKKAGLQKITFAGGEPMLYKWIFEVVQYAKSIGLTTSIITNGSMLTDQAIEKFKGNLDWIGISIDSLSEQTNIQIGRQAKNNFSYQILIAKIKEAGFKLKINTVVNRYNENENMQAFIKNVNPSRWKIFDTLKVEGQNDVQFSEIATSKKGFENFIKRHSHKSMVCENNEAMTGSYLLIDPQGRLFENSKGKHTYSSPLQDTTIDHCLSEISLDRETFIKRGGLYKW